MTLIAGFGFNPQPGHVVTFIDKTLYDDYLCLVASNKQQIQKSTRTLIVSLETPKQMHA